MVNDGNIHYNNATDNLSRRRFAVGASPRDKLTMRPEATVLEKAGSLGAIVKQALKQGLVVGMPVY